MCQGCVFDKTGPLDENVEGKKESWPEGVAGYGSKRNVIHTGRNQ